MKAPLQVLIVLHLLCLARAEDPRERQLRLVRETEPLTPEQQQAKMRVPEGFTIQVFASEPMINKPINLAFDERGRLWVSSNTEYPYAAKKERWSDEKGTRIKDSRDAIKILEDTDGDGRADKVTDFADGLNIPTGVLPWHKPGHKAGCIAWSIPNIWYFADTDGDEKCDLREVLFGPLGYEKDTHGMCSSFRLGADGWVYATHGFNNTSRFKAKDGSSLDLTSGNVFRFRPDGSRVEPWSWGQTNPFGLCWDRRGNLYSADCHSNPITQLLPGASYPSYRQTQDPLGYAPVICKHSHGSTGLCGVAYVDGGIWGPEWDDHMFLGNCVNSRVNVDRITFTGTTPHAAEKPDFVTCEDPWFRPVDLQLGPDHALYIADFYNRIIGHYEVPLSHPGRDRERGRIWRVVKKGAANTPRPGPPAPRQHALEDLRSSDPFVRRSAAAWFYRQPEAAATPLLLAALQTADPADAQLQHQLRIALREHLKLDGAFSALSRREDIATALSIATAVPTAAAAAFVFQHQKESPISLPDRLVHLARYGDPTVVDAAIQAQRADAPQTSAADQAAALGAFHNGFTERGMSPPASLLAWATALAERLLAENAQKDSVPQEPSLQPGKESKRFQSENTRTSQLQSLATILRGTAPVGLRDRLAPYLPKPATPTKSAPQPQIDALIKSRILAYASAQTSSDKGETAFKTHCAACHQIKGQGGHIGPQLDGIGSRGPERLIEDILDPNRNVDIHFRLHSLKLHNGSTAIGYIRGEVGQVVRLVDSAGNEQRIAKGDIATDTELPQSLMPPVFGQIIESTTFNHLIRWLLTQ